MKAAGVAIAAIADLRPNPTGVWIERAHAAGIEVRSGTCVTGTYGRLRVSHASLAPITSDGIGVEETIACDLVLMSGGFTPSVHLFSQSRGKLVYDETLQAYVPGTSVERERSVGGCRGIYDLDAVLSDGLAGGADAARAIGASTAAQRAFDVQAESVGADGFIGATPHGRDPLKARAWVDFQNDVTSKDIKARDP